MPQTLTQESNQGISDKHRKLIAEHASVWTAEISPHSEERVCIAAESCTSSPDLWVHKHLQNCFTFFVNKGPNSARVQMGPGPFDSNGYCNCLCQSCICNQYTATGPKPKRCHMRGMNWTPPLDREFWGMDVTKSCFKLHAKDQEACASRSKLEYGVICFSLYILRPSC